jgi:DNA-binding MarR family transcriptional regulator
VKRESKIQGCRELLEDESPSHLHIRRRTIVTGFTDDFKNDLSDEYRVVSVDISEWKQSELMETLRHELQKELSTLKYYYSRIKTVGLTLGGTGANGGVETRPDYSRTSDYLGDVASNTEGHLLLFIDYHGERPVDGFSWIPKLDIPENATIVTDGFAKCGLDDSIEFEIGRLSPEETVDYLPDEEITKEEAAEIHQIHDGNPAAIEIAAERDSLKERLSSDALQELWEEVYEDSIQGEEYDLLTESSHLIDLDQRAVTSVTEMTRGQVKEILEQLERKGIVSREQSGLFTTDLYVKLHTSKELTGQELAKQHQMSFRDHAEKWVDGHESRMQELQDRSGEENPDTISPPDFDAGLVDPNFWLAIHHLTNYHDKLDKETFVEELREVEGSTAGIFAFGMLAQRFFFDDPTEALQELSDAILEFDEDIEKELFSGTLGVLFGFDVKEFVSLLSTGWSGDINTDELGGGNISKPDELVTRVQESLNSNQLPDLPTNVKMAVAHFIAIPLADSRTARQFFDKFGKTATEYGLEEEPFCAWANEVEVLIDELNPETESAVDEDHRDPHEENLESLNREIRNRIDLREYLEEHQSRTQQEFQQNIEKIRDRPGELADQYIQCGEHLEKMENSIFAYLWYTIGHELFAKVILGGENRDIFAKYNQLAGARGEQEKSIPEEDIVITREEVEEWLTGIN